MAKLKDFKVPVSLRILNFLKKHPDEYYTRIEIAEGLKLSSKNVKSSMDKTDIPKLVLKKGMPAIYSINPKVLKEIERMVRES